MRLFGTNGIRGVANVDMNPEMALQVGKSVASVLGVKKIAIATDPRISSAMVKYAVCSGIMAMGADVLDLGIVPTPALQYYVKNHADVGGGVIITASHNPPEYNGIKCISDDGTEFNKEQESAVEDVYDTEIVCPDWNEIGHVVSISNAGEEYVNGILSNVDVTAVRNAHLTVCLDCSNGASFETSPLLLKKLGVRAITINGNPQGEFPGHLSEPTEDNLTDLKKMVVATGSSLGIAHDGDADRCIFVSNNGDYISGDKSLALLSKYLISKYGGKGGVFAPVSTSMVVEDTVRKAGGTFGYTAVGSPIVARKMMAEGGLFGGEENGGLIFSKHQYCRDGAMGFAIMLENIAINGPIDKQVNGLSIFYTVKEKVMCPNDKKKTVTDNIASFTTDAELDLTDGTKMIFDDGWVLLRASGTEPKFRVYSESSDKKIAEERAERYCKVISDILSQ